MRRESARSTADEMLTVTMDTRSAGRPLADARQGDPGAAAALVREHDRWIRSVIYAVCGRAELVDDIAQQVWTQVWERLDTLRDPERIRSWLYNIARNAAIDASMAHRRRQRGMVSLEAGPEPARGSQAGPLAVVIADETERFLLDAVQSLPAIYREPFVLRHLEDWPYAQIADVLGLSVESVETRLVRARRLLREALKGKV
ncbi:MAG: ECF RNA polymerase sigma factor SigW [Phycisphaerae bacterium]|nr:ECF RNA polymerase sigma factor SigW [Phycisphaerae bacterium]